MAQNRSGRASADTGAVWSAIGAGALVAVLVTIGGYAGLFDPIEGWLWDRRFAWTASSAVEPTDAIVHVDIDDQALEVAGRWPWNRVDMAHAIDAIDRAGARTIVLDLIFAHPQEPRLLPSSTDIRDGARGSGVGIDDDARFAEAIARAGNVLLATAAGVDPEDETRTIFERPVEVLSAASAGSGFVEAGLDGKDAFIRRVRPATEIDGERVLQFGLRAAAHYIGIDPERVRVEGSVLRLGEDGYDLADGQMIIPWRPRTAEEVRAREEEAARGGRPFVSVDGKPAEWQLIHDRISITECVLVGRALARFERDRARAMAIINGSVPSSPPTADEIAETDDGAEWLLEDYAAEGLSAAGARLESALTKASGDDRVALFQELEMVRALEAWPDLRDFESSTAMAPVRTNIELLRERLDDKLVFIGWTAKGSLADFYPTAMGGRTPGVMVHSAIANGVLTDRWFARAPHWADALVALGLGLVTALVSGTLLPTRGWIAALGLVSAYALLNIYGLFGQQEVLLALGTPALAATGAWAASTLARAIEERKAKARVTKQFRSRVSAQLVDFLQDNPGTMNMAGEERELTMMFTDLAGFTSLSERLGGAQTVSVLNRCLGALTDIQLERRAYVNKFLGDGVMSFWGAPVEDDLQADHAVDAMLGCYEALARINADHAKEGLPPLGMRAGVATGNVIVGDCGAPPKLNDYTVIGDAVNLAARLESANKLMGTSALIAGRTYELLTDSARGAHTWRHLGSLRVVGQTADIPIHELVVPGNDMSDAEISAWVERTHEAVELFRAGEIEGSLEHWEHLSQQPRGRAGAVLYAEACGRILRGEEEHCGSLVLRSK